MMKRRLSRLPGARGFVLLDALIAILIFSFGILGLMAVQANASLLSSDAKYRSDAAMQADSYIAQMWTADPATLATDFVGDKDAVAAKKYAAWLKQLDCSTADSTSNCLPGAKDNPPTVTVTATGLVKVTVRWKAPNATDTDAAHQYTSVTQIDRT
jgi:type IV pilus assembly protein PilV